MTKKSIALALILLLALYTLQRIYPSAAKAQTEDSRIVTELQSGRVLFEKDADIKRPIASLTKILTAIVVLENADLQREITVPAECCGIEGSSIYLVPGEKLTVQDLLYGLMLRSGNDCAETLAVAVGGNIENFADMMNETAIRIGACNSHFVNPHGLHDDEHYSTARDMALITAHGMKNDVFRQIVGTRSKVIPNTEKGENRLLVNKNKLLYNYEYCIGVKTGYTKAAGRCLASAAEKDGMTLISVVLGCSPMYEISEENFENAFADFTLHHICDKEKFIFDYRIDGAKRDCEGYVAHDFFYPLRERETDKIRTDISTDDNLKLPLKKDEKIGEMKIYLENQLIFSQNIYSILDIEKKFDFLRPFKGWPFGGKADENKQISCRVRRSEQARMR